MREWSAGNLKSGLYEMRDRRNIELSKGWKEKRIPFSCLQYLQLLKPDWTSDVFRGRSSLLMGQTTNDKLLKMKRKKLCV